VQWPVRKKSTQSDDRFFSQGNFFTPDRKAQFIAPARPSPHARVTEQYPFRLNTGRIRDQWHTMTRSGLSPRLASHLPEPFVEMHPGDAAAFGLAEGGFARLRSAHGECVLKVVLSQAQRRGSLFAPIHWSEETASSACVGDLVAPAIDPYSGQPEAKATPVMVEPVAFICRGFALSQTSFDPPQGSWWSRVTVRNGHGLLVASNEASARWRDTAQHLFEGMEFAEYMDEPRGVYRAAGFSQGRLVGCTFLGSKETVLSWDAAKSLFESEVLAETSRRVVLSGRPADGIADPGPVICVCHGVSLNAIRALIATGEVVDVTGIGGALKAGTNCGSCLPEPRKILVEERLARN